MRRAEALLHDARRAAEVEAGAAAAAVQRAEKVREVAKAAAAEEAREAALLEAMAGRRREATARKHMAEAEAAEAEARAVEARREREAPVEGALHPNERAQPHEHFDAHPATRAHAAPARATLRPRRQVAHRPACAPRGGGR